MFSRLVSMLKGALLALILTVIFALLLAAGTYFFEIADGAVTMVVFLIGAVSAAAGAYAVSRAQASKGLVTGGTVGLLYYLILAAAALVIKKEINLDAHMAIMLAATVISGMTGGVLGMPK